MGQPVNGETIAVITTNHGVIQVRFFADKAPGHVKNFTDLAQKGYYDGILFHRVIPGFMIQGGCPNTRDGGNRRTHGTGGPGYTIPAEFNDVPHERGVLSMARTNDPNSAGSQFFVMVKKSTHLDGQYTAFGEVFEGIEVVDTIVNLPRDERDNPNPSNPARIESIVIRTYEGA
ncbi:MAG: peptidylprolyl isomerase [Fimbriimonadaceae bacterium]|nr:peptidylprolyl isomerase [Fimbriimonadaceae bacterium]